VAKEIQVGFKKLASFGELALPEYMSPGAAGVDLQAAVDEAFQLAPGETRLIPCGFAISLPAGFEAQIRPRSGLALKHGLSVLNSPGTIDADYRGEVGVIAINLGREPIQVKRGMRVAQMVIQEVVRVSFQLTDELDSTQRGEGGFGHTGLEGLGAGTGNQVKKRGK